MTETKTSLGARTKAAREERELTQADLAKLARVGLRSLKDYEADKTSPSAEALRRIATALGVSADHLLGLPTVTPDPQPAPAEAVAP